MENEAIGACIAEISKITTRADKSYVIQLSVGENDLNLVLKLLSEYKSQGLVAVGFSKANLG